MVPMPNPTVRFFLPSGFFQVNEVVYRSLTFKDERYITSYCIAFLPHKRLDLHNANVTQCPNNDKGSDFCQVAGQTGRLHLY